MRGAATGCVMKKGGDRTRKGGLEERQEPDHIGPCEPCNGEPLKVLCRHHTSLDATWSWTRAAFPTWKQGTTPGAERGLGHGEREGVGRGLGHGEREGVGLSGPDQDRLWRWARQERLTDSEDE